MEMNYQAEIQQLTVQERIHIPYTHYKLNMHFKIHVFQRSVHLKTKNVCLVFQKSNVESITQAHKEKEQELKDQESILEMVESQFDIENIKNQTLKNQITGTNFISILLMQRNTAP